MECRTQRISIIQGAQDLEDIKNAFLVFIEQSIEPVDAGNADRLRTAVNHIDAQLERLKNASTTKTAPQGERGGDGSPSGIVPLNPGNR